MRGRVLTLGLAAALAAAAAGCDCDSDVFPSGLGVRLRTSSDAPLADGTYRLDADADGVRQSFGFIHGPGGNSCPTNDCDWRSQPYFANTNIVFELQLVDESNNPTLRIYFDHGAGGPGFVELLLYRSDVLIAEGVFQPDYATAHAATDICSDIRSVDAQMILPDS
jgi:hypothetical protein